MRVQDQNTPQPDDPTAGLPGVIDIGDGVLVNAARTPEERAAAYAYMAHDPDFQAYTAEVMADFAPLDAETAAHIDRAERQAASASSPATRPAGDA